MSREARSGLASALFSQVRLRVLRLFLSHPSQSYQLPQVIGLVGSGRGAVQREVERLTRAGILNQIISGTRKVYQANAHSPIFEELRRLILKTAGLQEPLGGALKALASKIDVAFVYGSIARGEDSAFSDIDLMVIGADVDYGSLYKALEKAEKSLTRPINPNVMTPAEWRQKIAAENAFVPQIVEQPKLVIFGSEVELIRIGQPR
jgi:predicted nucleotidyltransferase